MVNFIKEVNESHLTMKSFTKGLVSNASAQLFPDSTHNSFTNILREHLNPKGQWEVAQNWKYLTNQCTETPQRKIHVFR